MRRTIWGVWSVLLALMACSAAGSGADAQGPDTPGLALYKAHCTVCHGRDGNLGVGGAKPLAMSVLSEAEMVAVVTHGKGAMAAFGNRLSPGQVQEVVAYVRTLKAKE